MKKCNKQCVSLFTQCIPQDIFTRGNIVIYRQQGFCRDRFQINWSLLFAEGKPVFWGPAVVVLIVKYLKDEQSKDECVVMLRPDVMQQELVTQTLKKDCSSERLTSRGRWGDTGLSVVVTCSPPLLGCLGIRILGSMPFSARSCSKSNFKYSLRSL